MLDLLNVSASQPSFQIPRNSRLVASVQVRLPIRHQCNARLFPHSAIQRQSESQPNSAQYKRRHKPGSAFVQIGKGTSLPRRQPPEEGERLECLAERVENIGHISQVLDMPDKLGPIAQGMPQHRSPARRNIPAHRGHDHSNRVAKPTMVAQGGAFRSSATRMEVRCSFQFA